MSITLPIPLRAAEHTDTLRLPKGEMQGPFILKRLSPRFFGLHPAYHRACGALAGCIERNGEERLLPCSEVSQQTLEGRAVAHVVVPGPEVADVALAAELGGPGPPGT